MTDRSTLTTGHHTKFHQSTATNETSPAVNSRHRSAAARDSSSSVAVSNYLSPSQIISRFPIIKPWNIHDATEALIFERRFNVLTIRIDEVALTRPLVESLSTLICKAHIQKANAIRYCYVQLENYAEPKMVRRQLDGMKIGSSVIVTELGNKRKIADTADSVNVTEVDPYVICVDNIPAYIDLKYIQTEFEDCIKYYETNSSIDPETNVRCAYFCFNNFHDTKAAYKRVFDLPLGFRRYVGFRRRSKNEYETPVVNNSTATAATTTPTISDRLINNNMTSSSTAAKRPRTNNDDAVVVEHSKKTSTTTTTTDVVIKTEPQPDISLDDLFDGGDVSVDDRSNEDFIESVSADVPDELELENAHALHIKTEPIETNDAARPEQTAQQNNKQTPTIDVTANGSVDGGALMSTSSPSPSVVSTPNNSLHRIKLESIDVRPNLLGTQIEMINNADSIDDDYDYNSDGNSHCGESIPIADEEDDGVFEQFMRSKNLLGSNGCDAAIDDTDDNNESAWSSDYVVNLLRVKKENETTKSIENNIRPPASGTASNKRLRNQDEEVKPLFRCGDGGVAGGYGDDEDSREHIDDLFDDLNSDGDNDFSGLIRS